MKMRILVLMIAVLFVAAPAGFSCGMSGGGQSSGGQSAGRDKYTKKRIKQLKQQQQALKHNQPGMGSTISSRIQQYNNPLAYTDNDADKAAVKKQRLINAIEILSLKNERGELNPQQQAKLRALIQYYKTNYMSGY